MTDQATPEIRKGLAGVIADYTAISKVVPEIFQSNLKTPLVYHYP